MEGNMENQHEEEANNHGGGGNTKGVIELNNVDALLAQNKLIIKQLADLTKKMERNQVAAITTSSTTQEGVEEEAKGNLEQANYIEIQEDKVFKEEVRANIKNQGETIKKLEFQVGCLAEKIPKPTDGFPSDTEKNPRGEAKKVRWEDCKMITTSDQEDEDKQSKLPQQPEDNSTEEEDRDHQEPEISQQELLKLYAPFPQLLNGAVGKRIYSRFLDLFASLHVNIPFIKAIQQMPAFIKYMKELLPRKSSIKGGQTIVLNKECSALIQPELPTKRRDLGSFHIACAIGETVFDRALCDLGASINLLPLSLVKRLQINEIMPTDVVIRLADKTQKQAIGVVENVLLKVGKYFLPTDFVILDMEESHTHPIILGRPFLATARALIDVEKGELILRIHDERLSFNVFKLSQEADQEHKEPSKDHNEMLTEEASTEAHPTYLETPLVDKQGKQQLPQLKEKLEEPKPLEACEDNITTTLGKEVIKSKAISKDTRKKVPRKWRNKKIPTEDFSPGDRVISAYFPDILPNLPTVPSQLPKVFTINRVLSLEHVEIIDTTNGYKSTARGEDFKHYQPP
ncbi:uncharacterized protein LOC130965481 [Arachis stenosperma]|uniref:uncharacterized protein LOC130965481 n=1 Tax=Arachis stenosperma TaxID=217475 RepID=UPI0025ABC943|nr:uncharacterized protein LOC130965481 [Arachis stenosperma]